MKVVGFVGSSGAGKTTLMEGVIAGLKAAGQRVSVVKHAHQGFEIDHEGKDSWRHRKAGAFEVVIASTQRLALLREFEAEAALNVHQLIAELFEVDWVLFEGFKGADLPKIELLRTGQAESPVYPDDPFVSAIVVEGTLAAGMNQAHELAHALPQPTQRPVFSRNDAAGVVAMLLQSGRRFDYEPVRHG